MHLTLKPEATRPAAANVLQQQACFDAFADRYNRERTHRAGQNGGVTQVGELVWLVTFMRP